MLAHQSNNPMQSAGSSYLAGGGIGASGIKTMQNNDGGLGINNSSTRGNTQISKYGMEHEDDFDRIFTEILNKDNTTKGSVGGGNISTFH